MTSFYSERKLIRLWEKKMMWHHAERGDEPSHTANTDKGEARHLSLRGLVFRDCAGEKRTAQGELHSSCKGLIEIVNKTNKHVCGYTRPQMEDDNPE